MRLGEGKVELKRGSELASMSMPELKSSRGGQASTSSVEVKLRKVIPVIPSTEPAKSQLMKDLTSIGCLGFAEKP